MALLKQRSDGKLLWCLAFTVFNKRTKKWDAKFEYTHSHDAVSVINTFGRALPRGYHVGRNILITGCAPAIGFFVEEESKDKIVLSA